MGLVTTLPSLVNAHLHSPYGPWVRGVTRSRPFELWMGDIMAREDEPPTIEQMEACAYVTGLENLAMGNTMLIDQHFGPQTPEHIYRAARAYEASACAPGYSLPSATCLTSPSRKKPIHAIPKRFRNPNCPRTW